MTTKQVMHQSLIDCMKNLRQRVREEKIDKDTAFPDWKALFSEWETEGTPQYTLTVSQLLEMVQAQ